MMMRFVHIGLSCGSEEKSDAFYGTLLGLEKKGSKPLPSELSGQIFNVDTDYTIIDYADSGSGLHFEIFIDPNISLNRPNPVHVCLEVGDLGTFLQKAALASVFEGYPKGIASLRLLRILTAICSR